MLRLRAFGGYGLNRPLTCHQQPIKAQTQPVRGSNRGVEAIGLWAFGCLWLQQAGRNMHLEAKIVPTWGLQGILIHEKGKSKFFSGRNVPK